MFNMVVFLILALLATTIHSLIMLRPNEVVRSIKTNLEDSQFFLVESRQLKANHHYNIIVHYIGSVCFCYINSAWNSNVYQFDM